MTTEPLAPPAHGTWNRANFARANHEAAHAVVAVAGGLRVLEARIDQPELDDTGIVRVVPDLERLHAHLLAILAGPLVNGTPIAWPPQAGPGDEGAAHALVDRLGLDALGWRTAHAEVVALLRAHQRETLAVSSALLETGALTGDRVHQLIEGA